MSLPVKTLLTVLLCVLSTTVFAQSEGDDPVSLVINTTSSIFSEVDENISPGEVVGVLNAGSAIEIALGLPESVMKR